MQASAMAYSSSSRQLEPPTAEDQSLVELYIPGLTNPALFHALPGVDDVDKLLQRHVPPHIRPKRDLSGEAHGRNVNAMIMGQSWRALAVWAAEAIIRTEPTKTVLLLELWLLRLHALYSLHLLPLHHRELSTLFYIISQTLTFPSIISLPPPHHPSTLPPMPTPTREDAPPVPLKEKEGVDGEGWVTVHPSVPFGLLVMRARAVGSGADGKRNRDEMRLCEIDALRELMEASRRMSIRETRAKRPNRAALWKQRAQRLALLLSSTLSDLSPSPSNDPSSPLPSDTSSAQALLDDLLSSSEDVGAAMAKVKLSAVLGDVVGIDEGLEGVVEPGKRREAKVLRAAVTGKWEEAIKLTSTTSDGDGETEAIVAENNRAVASLYAGNLDTALTTLTSLLFPSPPPASSSRSDPLSPTSPSVNPHALTTGAMLFNYATLVELWSDRATARKREALGGVAGLKSGGSEGLRIGSFKLD